MTVLQLISSGGLYGAENMVITLSKGLARMGVDGRVGVFLNAHRPNVEVARLAEAQGLGVEILKCSGRIDAAAVHRLRACIRDCNIGVVHTHGYKAHIYAWLAARGTGVPLVATCHGWPDPGLALRFYRFVEKLFLAGFTGVVAVSEDVADSLRRGGVPQRKIRTIPNGIDLLPFHEAQPGLSAKACKGRRFAVGVVGRLTPLKGIPYFLQAAARILKRFPETLFVLVGDGPDRGELEQLARSLGIDKNVVFAGQRQDMPGVYASLDVVVLPSINEGMPLALLEALAASRPVVATDVGAVSQLIIPEETGLLVPPRDVAGLQTAIERLLADPAQGRRLAANGYAHVAKHFSAEAMAENYFRLYQELVRRRHEPEKTLIGAKV